MTSFEVKKLRLTQQQLIRAKSLAGIDPTDPAVSPPAGSVLANPDELSHNNTYGRLPRFYVDRVVVCRNCGTEEVWPAERQKWWYEVRPLGQAQQYLWVVLGLYRAVREEHLVQVRRVEEC